MSKEFSASKTQLAKAAELGIDTRDAPGHTTLGARLEAAGWRKDGKVELEEGAVMMATLTVETLAARKTPYELRQERKEAKRNGTYGQWTATSDEDDEGRPRYSVPTTSSITVCEE